MKIIYDNKNEYEIPDIYLCNPDRRQLAVVNGENITGTLRLNDLSELSLTVPKYLINQRGEKIEQPCYSLLESRRLLYVSTIGWFEIKNITEEENEETISKTVTAQSHQAILTNKSISVENRVYCFYNEQDPLDERYDESDVGAIPSVVGQLYQQAGIILNLDVGDVEPTEDYKQWTIIYIEPELYYKTSNSNNVCRTFEEAEEIGAYDFLINECQEAFEVMWLFDYLHHTIKIKYITSVTTPTDIYLSFDNLIENIQVDEDAEDIVTVLTCKGSDLNIRTVNPMGTGYIVNFDYYRDDNNKWMSKALRQALDEWEALYNNKKDDYATLVQALYEKYMSQTELQKTITDTDLKVNELENARDTYISQANIIAETVMNNDISKDTGLVYSSLLLYNFHQTAPKVVDGEFVFEDTGANCNSATAFENKRLYFIDNDTKTYCKLIKKDDVYGYERYGIYEDVYTWADTNGTFGGIITAETIEAGENSLDKESVFYTRKFTLNSTRKYHCYKEAPKIVVSGDDISSFYFKYDDDAETMYDTMNKCYNAGYYYLVEDNASSYLKMNGEAIVNVDQTTATYYVGSLSRYTTLNNTGIWIKYFQELQNNTDEQNENIQAEIDNTLTQMTDISNQCNILKFMINKDSSGALSQELACYWIEGSYENNNLAVLDTTTMADAISLAKELMNNGEEQLKKVSQPKYSFTISTQDFTKIKDFKKFAYQLELGKTITVEKSDGLLFSPAVTEISLNLEEPDNFSLVFSSSATLNGNEFTFADMIAESNQAIKEVKANWQDLVDYSKNKTKITSLIVNPLDRTLRYGQDKMSRQEFIVDNTGILGRRYADESKTTFVDEQIRIINNLILFTDDNWKSTKTALGRIFYEQDGQTKSAYGLIAETLVGSLIMGETLQIINPDSSIVLNKDGIIIKSGENSKITLSTSDSLMMKIDYNNDVIFSVDNAGKLSIVSGYIGTTEEGFLISSKYISHKLTDSTSRVLIGTGEDSSVFNVANRSVNHLMLMAGENFGVTRAGDIYANSGYISDLQLKKTFVQSYTGEYLRINNQLVKFSDLTKYSEIYTTDDNGEYVSINGSYLIGSGLSQYDGFYAEDLNGLYFQDSNGQYALISSATHYKFAGYSPNTNGIYTKVSGDTYVEIDKYDKYSQVYEYNESTSGDYILQDEDYVLYADYREQNVWYDYDEETEAYIEDDEGWYLLIDGEYVLQTPPIRYSQNLTYIKDDNGNYIKVEGLYYLIVPCDKVYLQDDVGEYIMQNGVYVLVKNITKYRYEYYIIVNSGYVLYSSLQKYTKSYQEDANGIYLLIDGEYVDNITLPRYDENGNTATTVGSACGLYSENFKLESQANADGTSSILSFIDEDDKETVRLSSRGGVTAQNGLFSTIQADSAIVDAINITKLTTGSGMQIYGNTIICPTDSSYMRFGVSVGGQQYIAKLSWEWYSRLLELKIYNTSGDRTSLPQGTTFVVKYACIWGGETTWNAWVGAGSNYASKDTKAFWGIDYARFAATGTRSYSFSLNTTAGKPVVELNGILLPASSGSYNLGSESRRWNTLYATNGSINTSDIKNKKDVNDITDVYDNLFDLLRPVTFKFKDNESDRTHLGLIANEFEESINQVGLTTKDVAAFCSWKDEDGTKGCGIRYTELIALNIYEIQNLKKRVVELEKQLSELNK